MSKRDLDRDQPRRLSSTWPPSKRIGRSLTALDTRIARDDTWLISKRKFLRTHGSCLRGSGAALSLLLRI